MRADLSLSGSRLAVRQSVFAVVVGFAACCASADAAPWVEFDTPATVACRERTDEAFESMHPGERLWEARFRISALMRRGEPDALLQFFLTIEGPGGGFRVTDYEPKTTQEQALKGVLLDFQDGVNTLDAVKVGNLIHENASIMTGRDRKILSKAQYVKILPKRLAENPPISLGKPKIAVAGNRAEVKIYMTRGNYNGLIVYHMKLDKNRWYIQSWKY